MRTCSDYCDRRKAASGCVGATAVATIRPAAVVILQTCTWHRAFCLPEVYRANISRRALFPSDFANASASHQGCCYHYYCCCCCASARLWGLSVRVSSRGLRLGVPPTRLQYMIGVTFPCVDVTQCARRHFVSDNALEVAAFRG